MSDKKKKEKKHDHPAEPASAVPPEAALSAEPPPPAPPPAAAEEPLREQLLRLRADFDNFRKRTQREREGIFQLANEALFSEMLPVMDHFEMGLKSAEDHHADRSVTEGFRLVYNQMLDLLKKFSVTPVDADGEPFDPHRHQALARLPSDQPAETVIEQTRRGWMLGDRLLRPAQVVVSAGPGAGKDDE